MQHNHEPGQHGAHTSQEEEEILHAFVSTTVSACHTPMQLTYLQATARLRLLSMTKVYMLRRPGLYSVGDMSLKKTATA